MTISKAEQCVAKSLRSLMQFSDDQEALDSIQLASVVSGLERFVPQILAEQDPLWRYESLDGVFPTIFRREYPLTVVVAGSAILISDQTYVPLHVRLQNHPVDDMIVWGEVRLGQKGPTGMVRNRSATCYVPSTLPLPEEWAHAVTFGEKAVWRNFEVAQFRPVVAAMMADGWKKVDSIEDEDDFESITLQRRQQWVILEWCWEDAWLMGTPTALDQACREYFIDSRTPPTGNSG